MRLWRRASGAIKDKGSVWLVGVAQRTAHRQPELEAAIIKATSHDESSVDYKNAQRVYQWLRASPSKFLRPTVHVISKRAQKTRSWAVALKALILLHGVFYCKVADAGTVGRLPFDLSNFIDGHTRPSATWAHSAFVRVYFAFLDQRAAYVCAESEEGRRRGPAEKDESIGRELLKIQKWQHLLNLLIQIRPMEEGVEDSALILEAMDCVIVEIFDVYSSICDSVARILVRIHGANAFEARMALRILKAAAVQSERLSEYFESCSDIGVLNAKEQPRVERIPEEDIAEVERIINGLSKRSKVRENVAMDEEQGGVHKEDEGGMRTVITEEWEVFDDDLKVGDEGMLMIEHNNRPLGETAVANSTDSRQPLRFEDVPDLISF